MRRHLILTGSCLLACWLLHSAAADDRARDVTAAVDHLVFIAPDLDAGIAAVEALTGVRAAYGGSHPGLGTRNALLSLGPSSYLEIIAPDPTQPGFVGKRPFRIDDTPGARLVTWAAKSDNVAALAALDLPGGANLGTAAAGSRRRPDGVSLSWRFTDPGTEVAGGVVPFFIDWGDTPHPATSTPAGVTLKALRFEHPDPTGVLAIFDALGITASIETGPEPALVAELDTPKGRVLLR